MEDSGYGSDQDLRGDYMVYDPSRRRRLGSRGVDGGGNEVVLAMVFMGIMLTTTKLFMVW